MWHILFDYNDMHTLVETAAFSSSVGSTLVFLRPCILSTGRVVPKEPHRAKQRVM